MNVLLDQLLTIVKLSPKNDNAMTVMALESLVFPRVRAQHKKSRPKQYIGCALIRSEKPYKVQSTVCKITRREAESSRSSPETNGT
ncbi:hypothetical protein RRG08_050503 [Elysia crispata]|uniref:Uncharacterized protein n=1 Tax=Elysia crispata TaxID=231223 RepID=A0AAE0XT49_9GAST|nr:hypothetical protein RRG08_050503 [Elysia crispata]